MRTAHGTIQTHLDLSGQNRAQLLRVTRKDGTIFRFTDRDTDLVWDDGTGDETYSAASGFTASSILSAIGVGIQGGSITMAKVAGGVTNADIVAGVWKDAQCLLVVVNASEPNAGYLILFGGEIAKITDDKTTVIFEVRGLVRNTRQIQVESYSYLCRADLGDTRCGVDIDALKELYTVDTVSNSQKFTTLTLSEADNYWNLGVLRWLTGSNAGIAMEVKKSVSTTKEITLAGVMPFTIAPGDTGEIWPGCDKALTTCISRYSNAINFRGEPYIPLPNDMESGL